MPIIKGLEVDTSSKSGLNNQPIDISTGGFMTALLARIASELIQALDDALFIASVEGGILDINTSAETMFGYTREQLLGKPLKLLLPERFCHRQAEYGVGSVAGQRDQAAGHALACTKAGTEFPVEIAITRLCTKERSLLCVQCRKPSGIIDITRQKKVEEALRKSVEELRQLKAQLKNENKFLREVVDQSTEHSEIIGRSAALARVLEQVKLVAVTSSTVLISGETGTGKELIARAIHQHSNRSNCMFVAVNCAALPTTLVESELFGHEKGAFTGAIARRVGRFEQGDGGTLFLDEVGELPLETQAKLLRVLQSGEFERVGSGRPIKVDVRVISASNQDLELAMRNGHFRNDLYHRLAVFPIHLPPLRERREDIPLLAAYLVTRKAHQLGRRIDKISDTILERLNVYDWPGNVRELENVLERSIILSPGTSLRLDAIHLGSAFSVKDYERHTLTNVKSNVSNGDTLQVYEREYILSICRETDWRIKGTNGAAKRLGLNPGTLYSRMKKLGIKRPETQ